MQCKKAEKNSDCSFLCNNYIRNDDAVDNYFNCKEKHYRYIYVFSISKMLFVNVFDLQPKISRLVSLPAIQVTRLNMNVFYTSYYIYSTRKSNYQYIDGSMIFISIRSIGIVLYFSTFLEYLYINLLSARVSKLNAINT